MRKSFFQQQSQSGERFLMAWTWSDAELRVFADPIFNGTDNCVAHIRRFNPESVLSPDAVFTTLWARAVELDVAESLIHFRDYPLPYMNVRDAHYFGTLVGAEQLMGGCFRRRICQNFGVKNRNLKEYLKQYIFKV